MERKKNSKHFHRHIDNSCRYLIFVLESTNSMRRTTERCESTNHDTNSLKATSLKKHWSKLELHMALQLQPVTYSR